MGVAFLFLIPLNSMRNRNFATMEISAKYNPSDIENKWYQHWLSQKYFRSVPDERPAYTIVIPPPNVTGVLHMGHMLNNTIQDVLIRKARKQGYNACWVPGTDHASIATEAKVVKLLAEQGIPKSSLTREEFLKHAFDWKEKYGGIILQQLQKLGASCDWDRTRFTMEPSLYEAVVDVFVDLYKKGLIYRGTKMVNWDPAGQTTLSDEEVIFKETPDQLYYVIYKGVDFDGELMVATARPETIAGDVAVCVNPNDERYQNLIGKKVRVPLIGREVEIIADDYIDIAFGTGVLKVTPAHDINDYNIGLKYNLPVIDTLNADGTISNAGELFVGEDRFVARKQWVKSLKEAGLLSKQKNYIHNVGYSERTDAVVEPRISTQWFMDMQEFMRKNPEVLSSVMDDEIKFYPAKLKNTYRHWMENVKDWNISRQLWWGHRIPAWYAQSGDWVVAKTAKDAVAEFAAKGVSVVATDLTQDPDVLDTWFSSWLWPISVFDGIGAHADKTELDYYYPTNDLVTGPDILFFWVARMIMAGYEFEGKMPFKNVYFTGLIRDKQRRKMSKSLGNSPDALELIEKFGADSVRMGLLLCSPAGNDILFDETQIEQGRNFCNKIWNAFRLIQGWDVKSDNPTHAANQAKTYMEARLNDTLREIEHLFVEFRLSDALMAIYKLIWDDFCSVYLEAIKPPYGEAIPAQTKSEAQAILHSLMSLLHPYMPFITEEIVQLLTNGTAETLVMSAYPKANETKEKDTATESLLLVTEIRNTRNTRGISPKEMLNIWVPELAHAIVSMRDFVEKLANVAIHTDSTTKPVNGMPIIVGVHEIWVELSMEIDVAKEREELEKEKAYYDGFIMSVKKKLENERFVQNAKPEIVEVERKKLSDATDKLSIIEKRLTQLG
jgi:valyl-tRNA synthetase